MLDQEEAMYLEDRILYLSRFCVKFYMETMQRAYLDEGVSCVMVELMVWPRITTRIISGGFGFR
jgi:hypothetical protein